MNSLDIIFLVLIGVSVVYSLVRGLAREIFSFLSLILGFLGASHGYSAMAGWLKRWVENPTLAQILGFALLFLLIALVVFLAGKALAALIKKMDLGWADRLGGAGFGFLKAILLIAIILLVLTAFLPSQSKILSESKVSPVALSMARFLSYAAPEKLRTLYREKETELREYWVNQERPTIQSEGKGSKK